MTSKQQELNFGKAPSKKGAKGIIAIADDQGGTAGAVVWWRLSGAVDYADLRHAWLAAKLDERELLSPCSSKVALRRAVNTVVGGRILVRRLPAGAGGERGWAVVRESAKLDGIAGMAKLRYKVLFHVALDPVERLVFSDVVDSKESYETLKGRVRESFKENREQLESVDFSSWLVKLMPSLDAVSLREMGGIYFIPPDAIDRLGRIVNVISGVTSHTLNRIPAMRSAQAVAAIVDAVTDEADLACAHFAKIVEEDNVGERGLRARVEDCKALENKVARYETLLGTKLEAVRERLDEVRANLVAAALLKASAEAAS